MGTPLSPSTRSLQAGGCQLSSSSTLWCESGNWVAAPVRGFPPAEGQDPLPFWAFTNVPLLLCPSKAARLRLEGWVVLRLNLPPGPSPHPR